MGSSGSLTEVNTFAGPSRPVVRKALIEAVFLLLATAYPTAGQLRPYDPFDWSVFDADDRVDVEFGSAILWNQRASLAGTEGLLVEAGTIEAVMRTANVALEVSGTIRRFFADHESFAEPLSDTRPPNGDHRADFGDFRVATTIGLGSPDRPTAAALRFGTRLPTTDNRIGLERDRIDFFALLLGRTDQAPLRTTAAFGVGVHGTRSSDFEQSDVLIYQVGLEWTRDPVRLYLDLVGHADG
ncbi:MAG: hypothetical protein GEU90_10925, partial [Gemmatimonas sp.]|nr:hypothetical protein [Gemmatimonas sp.]